MTDIPEFLLKRSREALAKAKSESKPTYGVEDTIEEEKNTSKEEPVSQSDDTVTQFATATRELARMIRDRTAEIFSSAGASLDDVLGRAEEMARQTWGVVDEDIAAEPIVTNEQQTLQQEPRDLRDVLNLTVRGSNEDEPFVMNVRYDGKKLNVDVAMPSGAEEASASFVRLLDATTEAIKQQSRPKRPSSIDTEFLEGLFGNLRRGDSYWERLEGIARTRK